MEALVIARGLVKRYPQAPAPAVDGIDFTVRPGECFGYLGPNGAGKTTTMRLMSCSARRSEGHLEVLGLDPSRDGRSIKARLGIVPQENNLDTVLSVQENLVVYARYFGMPRADAQARSEELLRFVQLDDRADWHIKALSGGMKRRLLIARGLMNRPPLLILDEPTTGLDPQARHLVWERLRELKRSGTTQILTTHYMEEAARLCDRLVIMHQGKVLAEGPPRDLIAQHISPEVLELTFRDRAERERLVDAAALADSHEVAGDRLILHTATGEGLLKTINYAGVSYESATFRPASLEDVFLKLTGRRLEE